MSDSVFFDDKGFLTEYALGKGYIERSQNEGKIILLSISFWKDNGIFNIKMIDHVRNNNCFFESFFDFEEAKEFFIKKTHEYNLVKVDIKR